LFPDRGLGHCDQLRVLSCDGSLLLGWVGGFRDELFSDAECAGELAAIAEAPPLHDALVALAVPGLSLRGSLDRSMPREQCEAFARACTPGTHEELEGLGHAAMVEDEAGTATRIAAWLSAPGSAPSPRAA
jgi:pimeloyl-ACP methyl ester carboxylesterase